MQDDNRLWVSEFVAALPGEVRADVPPRLPFAASAIGPVAD